MDDFNNDKLDALFQEGSERYDFTYREDAWDAMDGMLNEQDKKRKIRFLGWWLLVGFTTFVGAFLLIKYTTFDNYNPSKNVVYSNEIEETSVQNTVETPKVDKVESGSIEEANLLSKNETSESGTLFTTVLTEQVTPNQKVDSSTEVFNTQISTGKKDILKDNNPLTELVNVVQNDFPVSNVISSSNPENSKNYKEEKKKKDSPIFQISNSQIDFLPINKINSLTNKKNSLSQIQLPEIILDKNWSNIDQAKSKIDNRFSFGLSIGLEYSFILGGNNVQNPGGESKAGYYVGLELGYLISNKIELVTGVGISRKTYTGNGDQYNAKPGFWIDQIKPEQFNGKCTVIEIPLSVNYYFNSAKENGWFTNLGVTSYMMNREWYGFIYDPSLNRDDLKTSWNDKRVNNHILGVGQVSFGYQRKVGKNLRLQISPYAKIPLTGIGNGAVNLFSTGMRVTARLK